MLQEANQGLEDVLYHNNTTRRTQEGKEDIQCQEEYWREKKQIRKPQEEAEKRNKQYEIDAYINNWQQITEDQQSANVAIEHANEQECVHTV